MKKAIIYLMIGWVIGAGTISVMRYVPENSSAYSTHEMVDRIMSERFWIGRASTELSYRKEWIYDQFRSPSGIYRRTLFQDIDHIVLLTTENERIIEIEIWGRAKKTSVFYESDPDALVRYGQSHPN